MSEIYRLSAHNSLPLSENKIHDDAVARRLGFVGGLVPGVDVYAYMTHPVVGRWGLDWLMRGAMEARFSKPVYDGKTVDIYAADEAGSLALSATSEGVSCGSGRAWLAQRGTSRESPADVFSPPVSTGHIPPAARPAASEQTLAVGRVLGMAPVELSLHLQERYLAGARESNPIYLRERVAHPGWMLRAANSVLKESVVLGPWLHVQSRVTNFDVLRVGETLDARGRVTANYEKKGHRFVDVDVELWASAGRHIAHVQHVAIWQIRSAM